MENALILAGAVAKGAFEAGALEVLAERGIGVRRIVSASAGSLNAAVFAAGLRVGRPLDAARGLVEAWTDHARWNDVFAPSATALLGLRGLSRTDRVRGILDEQLTRWLDDPSAPPAAERTPIELRLVVTLANGTVEPLGPGHATTFERVLPFDGAALDDRGARQPLIDAATASAAFPLVFLPVDLGDGLGPAFDGGAVDNAPIHEAVHGTDIDRVFVVSTGPAEVPPLPSYSGEAMVNRMAEILIGERLFRDMADAYRTNASLRALDALVADGALSPEQLRRVRQSLGWGTLRPLEIVPIQPSRPLEGGPFSGFFSADTRRGYIDAGRQAAVEALGG